MIKPAQIDWSQGTPISPEFDDVYFSKASGIDETRYVFLKHNQLTERWGTQVATGSSKCFTIAETGFGTGLNFLCTWQAWHAHVQAHPVQTQSTTLHFISVEKFPLTRSSLEQALKSWPELNPYSKALLEQYPPLVEGWHLIHFPEARVTLHLYFGDIHDWLPSIEGQVDAWFLDGFAPSKNPDMWNDQLFHHMQRITAPFGTVATFTCAGLVKRGLKGAGFEIKKMKGFGHKREMLTAINKQTTGPVAPHWLKESPWLVAPGSLKQSHNAKTKTATVIGAGIAGCSTAFALAKRGWHVNLIEKQSDIAQGGSGNPQGVLYAKLSSDMNTHSQFYLAGYLYSLNLLKQLMPEGLHWDDCGVLQLGFSEKEQQRQQSFCEQHDMADVVRFVSPDEASKIAGVSLSQGGLYFPSGAWVSPRDWCKKLIDHPNIHLTLESDVTQVTLKQDGQWEIVQSNHQISTSQIVVVSSAHASDQFDGLGYLPLKAIPGQVTQAELKQNERINLNTVLCGSSYVAPAHNDQLVFGASYRLKTTDDRELDQDNQDNLKNLSADFSSVAAQLSHPTLKGRAANRCTVPDYTPITGPVLKESEFMADFANLKKNKRWRFNQPAQYWPGLYVNTGHGSRGLSSAPLCGELLAAQINAEPWPLPKSLGHMLSPSRFLVKALTK